MKRPSLRNVVRATAAAFVIGIVAIVSLNAWVLASTRDAIFSDAESVPQRRVAIVLGARVWSNGEPSRPLSDRLATALELWELGRVDRILVSGDHSRHDYDEVNAMREWLVARGVPDDAIFTDHAGLRTHDTMVRAAKVFEVDEAIVCTQRFHLFRSVYLARQAGIDAVGVPADRTVYVSRHWDAIREALARPIAVLDALIERDPKHLGPPVPVTGPASASRG
jgi:SanA protein